jgi:lipid-A-disaccharide synthase
MPQPKHIVIVAGEESGDQHAAAFVRTLHASHPELQFSGVGGQHMQAAGVELISDLANHGVTGLTEILRHVRIIRQTFVKLSQHLRQNRPDLLILIDCPGFNLRIVKFAKEVLNLRILYYISPQIWAWKANRIHTIRRYVDKMAVILPFEKQLYEKTGVPVAFVGHPLVERMTIEDSVEDTKTKLGIPHNKFILALLPGSRHNEIKRLLPVFQQAAHNIIQHYPNLHIVIPIAGSIKREEISKFFDPAQLPVTFIAQQATATMYCSDLVIVASGTASLECALLTKPMGIVYTASLLTYITAMYCIKVKYLGLCNLLANKMIVPELLQYDFSAQELTRLVLDLLADPSKMQRMVARLQTVKKSLSNQTADLSISELILEELGL